MSTTTDSEYEQAVQQDELNIKTAENTPVVVFAHGTDAPSTSQWMIRWKNLLANALDAVEVVTFDYPYILEGRKAPPDPKSLVGYHSDIVRKVVSKYPEHPLILVGRSMGSRISCMVAAENDIDASAVVCLGYSLKDTNGDILDEPLLQLTVPIMFVQGGNDIYCPLDLLEGVMNKLDVVNALHVIENADHSFQIANKHLKLTGMTHEKAEEGAVEAVAVFVSQITSEKDTGGLPLRSCTKGVLPQPVLTIDAIVEDDAAGEQNRQPIKSQPKIEKFSVADYRTTNMRKRKSERIIKNKLRKTVYEKDGRGMTVDKPLCIDD